MEELGGSRGRPAAAAPRKRQTGTSPSKGAVRYKTYSKAEDPLISAKVCVTPPGLRLIRLLAHTVRAHHLKPAACLMPATITAVDTKPAGAEPHAASATCRGMAAKTADCGPIQHRRPQPPGDARGAPAGTRPASVSLHDMHGA